MNVKEWHEKAGEAHTLVDVREAFEFSSVHAEGAVNFPMSKIRREDLVAFGEDRSIGLLCKSGARAQMVRKQFSDLKNLVVIEGGTQAWVEAGLPHVKGNGPCLSLDRQMRILIGALVLAGVVLFLTGWEPGIYLSGLMGAGLIFAGLTDTCPMAMVVARMPWNRGCATNCCGPLTRETPPSSVK